MAVIIFVNFMIQSEEENNTGKYEKGRLFGKGNRYYEFSLGIFYLNEFENNKLKIKRLLVFCLC